jgi:hypothetical protein
LSLALLITTKSSGISNEVIQVIDSSRHLCLQTQALSWLLALHQRELSIPSINSDICYTTMASNDGIQFKFKLFV